MGLNQYIASKMVEKYAKADYTRLNKIKLPKGITEHTNIPYISDHQKGHLLDVYYPESTLDELPVIIDFHPGGFIYGYKEINKPFCFALAKKGFIVFSVNYRLALDGITIPDQLKDAVAAIKWISDHCDDYPANKESVFLTGASAGALLAALAVLTIKNERLHKIFGTETANIDIKAIGLISGLLNLETKSIGYWGLRSIALEKGYEKKAYYKNLVFDHIPEMKDFPPAFLVSSEEDELGFMTKTFQKTLEKNHIEYELTYFNKTKDNRYEHIFCLVNPERDESIALIAEMIKFFKSFI